MKNDREERQLDDRSKPSGRAKLERELKELREECERYRAGWQRCQADLANYIRRSEEERSRSRHEMQITTLLKITPILDNFRRAFAYLPAESEQEAWAIGLRQVEKSLRQLLTDAGFSEIPAAGPFDPSLHEAISHEDHATIPENNIIDMHQAGWQVQGTVVRPAQVRVSRGSDSTQSKKTAK